ncbi:DUF397 domain-containing protein [Streptomyces sp. NPDC052496]|uniref:DUF397 domain-containing protein n=1 Tax=Streptomyces sp. NPDC052496 TaxID=3154951 RepID=UPI00342F7697
MPPVRRQKSSYCADSSNCLCLVPTPDNTIRIRESEDPHTVVRATQTQLGSLIGAIKAGILTSTRT